MRRLLTTFGTVVLLLAAAYGVLWYWAEREMEAGWDRWVSAGRARGWTIDSGRPERGTSPLAATLAIPALALRGGEADIPGGVEFHAGRIVLELSLLHPNAAFVDLNGDGAIRLSHLPLIPFGAHAARATIPLHRGRPERRMTLHVATLSARPPGFGPGEDVVAATLGLDAAWDPDAAQDRPAVTLDLHADGIALPPGRNWPFGSRVGTLDAGATVAGPFPHGRDPAARVAAWRDAGGAVQIQRLALSWGKLNLSASARLTLDDKLQPAGTGTARVVAPGEMLDALAAHGAIGKRTAFAAGAVVALMERVPEGGGPPEMDVPVIIRDRALSMGQIPLARLPLLVWSAP